MLPLPWPLSTSTTSTTTSLWGLGYTPLGHLFGVPGLLPHGGDFLGEFVEPTVLGASLASTTSTTSSLPDPPAVEGQNGTVNTGGNDEIGDFVPVAGPEQLASMTLEELLDAELLGRLNQSGHLLMSLDQEPVGYNVVQEHAANRPPSIDWAHDLLHRIAQQMVDETHTAEQFGEPSTVRWSAHRAALEFREIGQLLCRLADLAMHNFRRPLSEPRTTPPINSVMHRHYRQWSHRWRGMAGQVVQEVFMHEDALDQQLRDDMQSREEHEQRLQQLRALEQLRVRPPSGPEAGLGVSVPRRPLGTQAGFKRTRDGAPVAVTTSAGAMPPSRRPGTNSTGVPSGACSSSDAPATMFGATTPRIPSFVLQIAPCRRRRLPG